jgi:hypothetical protein
LVRRSYFRWRVGLGERLGVGCLRGLLGEGGWALWTCGNEGCRESRWEFEDRAGRCGGFGERFAGLSEAGDCGLGNRLGETLGGRLVPGPAQDAGYEDEELVERLAKLLGGLVDLAAGDGDDEDLEEDGVGDGASLAKDDGADEGVEVVDEEAGGLQALGGWGEVVRGAEGEADGGVELVQLLNIGGVAASGWLRCGEGGHRC